MRKLKPLEPNRNNIETFLPVFNGFYGSQWDEPSFDGEADHFGLPDDFPFWDFVDWHKYHVELCKEFVGTVENEMRDFIERIDFQTMISPKEYNFTNDSIDCIIRPKKKAIKDFIYAHKPAFEKYLERRLKSRDGFMSFHSYSFEDWEISTSKFMNWDKKADSRGFNLGFVLDFIAEELEITQDTLDEDAYETHIGQFYNDKFEAVMDSIGEVDDARRDLINIEVVSNYLNVGYRPELPDLGGQIESVKRFVQENYMNEEVVRLTYEQFSSDNEEGFLNLDKIISNTLDAIASHTLELKFK